MDEPTLIAAAQKGDREAFNELIVHYQSLAYSVAYRVLDSPDAAADATQDAFLSAYRAVGRFRGGSFRAWLMRIVTNACYDQLRAKQRRPTTPLEGDPDQELEEWVMDPAERPDEQVERQELGRTIQRGLATLPADQRTIVVLSDIQGLSYDEVAQATALALGTVKSRLNRGRKKLRDYLMRNQELLPARYRLHDKTAGLGGLGSLLLECSANRCVIRLLGRGAGHYG
jgi:RNA polymerase sigma factor (sigma-70 family)